MVPKTYRKKPVEITAIQFIEENRDVCLDFVTCNKVAGFDEHGSPVLIIQTLEGNMTAPLGWWIIRGVEGEFYPCDPKIFEKTYEEVAEIESWYEHG